MKSNMFFFYLGFIGKDFDLDLTCEKHLRYSFSGPAHL